jgi:hypothetical protein
VTRAPGLGRGDAKPDHAGVRDQVGFDADRREHQRSLLGINKRAEPADYRLLNIETGVGRARTRPDA